MAKLLKRGLDRVYFSLLQAHLHLWRNEIMSERAQEDAYFYRLDRELIEELRKSKHKRFNLPMVVQAKKSDRSFYDFIDAQLQPDEHWIADL